MNKYSRTLCCILFLFISVCGGYAQKQETIIQNNGFKYIPVFDGNAVLIKEIKYNNSTNINENYNKMRDWVKNLYASDPVNSSIMFDNNLNTIRIKSKVEMILPSLNEQNINKKVLMNYQIILTSLRDRNVIEIHNIKYKLVGITPKIQGKIPAEDFVTEKALKIKLLKQEKKETLESTLYFFNNLVSGIEQNLFQTP